MFSPKSELPSTSGQPSTVVHSISQFERHCCPGASKPVPADDGSSSPSSGSILPSVFFSIQTRTSNEISQQRDRGLDKYCTNRRNNRMRRCSASPLHDDAFEAGDIFIRASFDRVQQIFHPLCPLFFLRLRQQYFLLQRVYIHPHARGSFFRRGGEWTAKSLSIIYIAPIETITSFPGRELFYYAEMCQFLELVGNNGLPHDTQFAYALASFSRFGKHYSYVAFGKKYFIPKLLPVQNVVFDLRSRKTSYPSGHSLPLLGLAPLLALALVHALSMALLRPFSSFLLSFAGDASPSVGLPALLSQFPDSQYNTAFLSRP